MINDLRLMICGLALAALITGSAGAETSWHLFTPDDGSAAYLRGESADGAITFVFPKKGAPVLVAATITAAGTFEVGTPRTGKTWDVTVEIGAWKSPQKWKEPQYPASMHGTMMPPDGGADLLRRFIAGGDRIRLRYVPPGKQSMVADFERAGIERYLPEVEARLKSAAASEKQPVKPGSLVPR